LSINFKNILIIILVLVPYGIQAAPVLDITVHIDLNNIPHPIVIPNNENDNGRITGHNIQNGR
jgi:hypothetical protein